MRPKAHLDVPERLKQKGDLGEHGLEPLAGDPRLPYEPLELNALALELLEQLILDVAATGEQIKELEVRR
jgi:hypothetical protein